MGSPQPKPSAILFIAAPRILSLSDKLSLLELLFGIDFGTDSGTYFGTDCIVPLAIPSNISDFILFNPSEMRFPIALGRDWYSPLMVVTSFEMVRKATFTDFTSALNSFNMMPFSFSTDDQCSLLEPAFNQCQ